MKNRYIALSLLFTLAWAGGAVGAELGAQVDEDALRAGQNAANRTLARSFTDAASAFADSTSKVFSGAGDSLIKSFRSVSDSTLSLIGKDAGVKAAAKSLLEDLDSRAATVEGKGAESAATVEGKGAESAGADAGENKLQSGEGPSKEEKIEQVKNEWNKLDRETKLNLQARYPEEFGNLDATMSSKEFLAHEFGYDASRTWSQFAFDRVMKIGEWVVQHALLGGLVMGMIFGMPNALQSQTGQKIANLVALANLGTVVQFGQWTLLQIPDEFINRPNAMASKKIYMLIPLHVPAGDYPKPWKPVVGPSDKNMIAVYIKDNGSGTAGSAVSALMSMQFNKIGKRIVPMPAGMGVNRYNLYLGSATLASYYDSAIFFASYPEASYGHIGEDGITDPTFSGRLVCLNNGAIIDESGIVYDAPLVPLFGMDTSQGPTIQEFLVKFYADIKTDDIEQSEFSHTNVEKTGVRSKDGKKVINALIRQFNMECIDTESRFG
ncbi:hypothetical protein EBQ93_00360, partial [bacterium]|nr:hypothetical protein [bacterium]